jgi:hypothetical protein
MGEVEAVNLSEQIHLGNKSATPARSLHHISVRETFSQRSR